MTTMLRVVSLSILRCNAKPLRFGPHVGLDPQSKTKAMLVGTRQKLGIVPHLRVKIQNQNIDEVSSYNYLGVIFDSELAFTLHLRELHNKVQRKVFQLSKIRRFITIFAALQVYKQTIMPILDYCNFMIMSGNKSDYTGLQVLQNDALRICFGYPNGYTMSRDELHSEAKLTGVLQRADKQLLNYMYDESKSGNNLVIPTRITRGSVKINFRQDRLINKKYIKSPFVRGKKLWDDLDVKIQTAESKSDFSRLTSKMFATFDKDYPTRLNLN